MKTSKDSNNFTKNNKYVLEYLEKTIKHLKDYDYVITSSRFTTDLLLAYMKDPNKRKSIKVPNFITYNQIDIIGNNFRDKTIAILDAVCTTGIRPIMLYKKLLKYAPKDIKIYVINREVCAPDYIYFSLYKLGICSKDDFNNNYYWTRMVLPHEAVESTIDCQRYIYSNNKFNNAENYHFYSSFYSIFPHNNVDNLLFVKHDIIPYEVNSNNGGYLIYKDFEKYSFIKFAALKICSYYDDKEKYIFDIAPYIILDNFTSKSLLKIWNEIFNNSIPKELECITSPTDIYRALKAIISLICYKNFKVESDDYTDINIIYYSKETDKSFCENFLEIVNKYINSDVLDIIESNFESCKINNDNTISKECLSEFTSSEKITRNNVVNKILCYFFLVKTRTIAEFDKKIEEGLVDGKLTYDYVDFKRFNALNINYILDHIPDDCLDLAYSTLMYLDENYYISTSSCLSENKVYTGISVDILSSGFKFSIVGATLRSIYTLDHILEKLDDSKQTLFINELIKELKNSKLVPNEVNLYNIEFMYKLKHRNLDKDYWGFSKIYFDSLSPKDNEISNIFHTILVNKIRYIIDNDVLPLSLEEKNKLRNALNLY